MPGRMEEAGRLRYFYGRESTSAPQLTVAGRHRRNQTRASRRGCEPQADVPCTALARSPQRGAYPAASCRNLNRISRCCRLGAVCGSIGDWQVVNGLGCRPRRMISTLRSRPSCSSGGHVIVGPPFAGRASELPQIVSRRITTADVTVRVLTNTPKCLPDLTCDRLYRCRPIWDILRGRKMRCTCHRCRDGGWAGTETASDLTPDMVLVPGPFYFSAKSIYNSRYAGYLTQCHIHRRLQDSQDLQMMPPWRELRDRNS